MNKSEFWANTRNPLKARQTRAYKMPLVLVLLPRGWKTGGIFLSQSLSLAIAISLTFRLSKNQNQSNYSDQSQQEEAARWTNHNSQQLAVTCRNSLEAREKSRVHGAIGFCFDSHWLKNWRVSFKPITKRSNRNHVITFDSYLKTALNSFHGLLLIRNNPCFHLL